VATEITAKSPSDGYTLSVVAYPIVTNPKLRASLPYDTSKDLTWITQLTSAPLVLLAAPTVKADTLQELIALAKRDPGSMTYATGGAGGSPHLAAVLLAQMGGIKMRHVPYLGNANRSRIWCRERFPCSSPTGQAVEFVRARQVKAIAVSTLKRSAALPEVPTIAESGLPGYEVPVWYGLFGPANIPGEVVKAIQVHVKGVLESPQARQRLASWGVEPVGSSPEAFTAFIGAELRKWASAIDAANIKPE
jgi:tripartite-type tricarboxylate transporter receptor subunit TctC